VSAYPGGDAMRLLRAINTDQAHGRVGSIVLASDAARAAGLEPGTERYEEAVWRLLVEGALEVDGRVPPGVAARVPFGGAPYLLASAAMRMLEGS
jgi:hypothetical protein